MMLNTIPIQHFSTSINLFHLGFANLATTHLLGAIFKWQGQPGPAESKMVSQHLQLWPN